MLLASSFASARRNGIVIPGCDACHGGDSAQLEITAEPASLSPGDEITLTVTVQRPDASIGAAGLYVPNPGSGQLRVLSGEGLTLIDPDGLVHSQPKPASGGSVSFRFAWRAPMEPGAVQFDAYGLAANGDGGRNGDVAGSTALQLAFGCELQQFYYDLDGDGYGNAGFPTAVGCAGLPPESHAVEAGDCNEGNAAIHPGAVEQCNGKDDDCNDQIDENAVLVELWPDEDGDGYYAQKVGTPVMGCVGIAGYAAEPGDCAPSDPTVNPGATEICNSIDDNCDQRFDERVRPQCGVGWCRRESTSCDMAGCIPGPPMEEICNLLDDDCDGETDEDVVCPGATTCIAGQCLATGEEAMSSPSSETSATGAGAAGAGAADESTPTQGVDSTGAPASTNDVDGGSSGVDPLVDAATTSTALGTSTPNGDPPDGSSTAGGTGAPAEGSVESLSMGSGASESQAGEDSEGDASSAKGCSVAIPNDNPGRAAYLMLLGIALALRRRRTTSE